MPSIEFSLALRPEEVEKVYLGVAQVHTTLADGRTLSFPSKAVRPFITHSGVHGRFRLTHQDGKFIELSKIAG